MTPVVRHGAPAEASPTPENAPKVTRLALREAAIRWQIDDRTLLRRLRGESIRGLAGDRADRAIAELGLTPGCLSTESRES